MPERLRRLDGSGFVIFVRDQYDFLSDTRYGA